jgi:hypothetical protein
MACQQHFCSFAQECGACFWSTKLERVFMCFFLDCDLKAFRHGLSHKSTFLLHFALFHIPEGIPNTLLCAQHILGT